ncbi:MAG: GNAT family N-acetyltransferase [Caldilinea sp. CFX5]|nr:GNAT family N-acetyltransferase [Caldilinea sp. CFX5]
MTLPDWGTASLASEIALSVAYGGMAAIYADFTHIHNPQIPWAGDFNRAVGVKCTSVNAFLTIATAVEQLHQTRQLDRPTRFDLHPSVTTDPSWTRQLADHHWRVESALFFQATAAPITVAPAFALYTPNIQEYTAWYQHEQQAQPFYNAADFQQVLPLQLQFIKTFQPYWLMANNTLVGSVYCAVLGDYCRLFAVEIDEAHRGQGMGGLLLRLLQNHCQQQGIGYLLLQSGERLRPFYERVGFQICSSNLIVWPQ